jgi:hypothetical protein
MTTGLKPPRKRTIKVPHEETWGKLVNQAEARKKIPYTLSGSFKENDLIDHTIFGLGVVTHLLDNNKIQVSFKEGEKLLISKRLS